MKPILFALLMSVVSLPAGAGDAIVVVPATPHKMFPQDWDQFAGRYALSNGQQMVLQRRGLRMYAQVTGRPRTQLVAVTADEFVAIDGQLKMTLVDEGDDRVSGTVTMPGSGQSPAMTAERVGVVETGRL